jgi:hypothetical protein
MEDQTQAYDIFQTPLSSGYPLPLNMFLDLLFHKINSTQLYNTLFTINNAFALVVFPRLMKEKNILVNYYGFFLFCLSKQRFSYKGFISCSN